MLLPVANQQETGVVRHLPPFVKIERDRIRVLDACKARCKRRRKDPERAIGAVDMEPELFFPAQLAECDEIVDRADIDGAGGSDHEEGFQAGLAVGRDLPAQRRDIKTMALIDSDHAQCIAAEARDIHGLADAAMRRFRRVGGQQRSFRTDAVLAGGLSQRRGTRHQHRQKICHRGAGDENPACTLREAEHRPRPFDDLALDLDRNVIPPAQIGVQSRREHLRQHADRAAAAMHPAHEARMHIAGRVRRDVIGEFAVDFGEIGRPPRKLGAKVRANVIGNRRPDRALADIGDVIEHVIEHAMTLRAQIVPAFRIERLARLGAQRLLAQHDRHAAHS